MAIYNGTQKVKPSGIAKVYVGSQLVYQSGPVTPYRKLEYIHFNGAEYVQTDFYAGTTTINHQSEFTYDDAYNSNTRCYIAIDDYQQQDLILAAVSNYSIFMRINLQSAEKDFESYSDALNNTKLKFSATLGKDGSGQPRCYYYLVNQVTSANVLSAAPIVSSTVGDLNTTIPLKIGCLITNSANSTTDSSYWKGNCYNYQRRQNNASGELLSNYVPCQRKIDSVCGLYDTVTNEFHPMVGTIITNAAAGPTVQENWDPTA